MNQPSVSSGLLEFLRKTFPDRLPRQQVSEFELGRLLGQQEIIDKISQMHDKEVRPHARAQS